MYKKLLFGITLFISISSNAQLRSPDEFLGYKIGTRYTPHWKIVNYFQHIAANASATLKLEEYGQTNEGRPLLLAFISSADNISRLEPIRLNNLRLANISNDKAAPVEENVPGIVWLSYNVHGNETSSSEAAMMTAWALVDPSNTRTKAWLKNTVVVIDPCINPDGRDRYVNWFNSIVGKNMNPLLSAREHREPWPGGRTNHYNFDLNRDWAWQTQVESQQRMKLYNQWLPHVHVDFHEQGINNPYYFAPAAQPFHEVITQWQRDFQVTIGKNHAKYFDANGWLYFTKEVFDLFYPSYGDTYPVYNGAIGMTYEQGGGPAGGLGALTDEGDTLTLLDRATHHHTTGLSTIEVSSINASRLVKEFRKFFNDAVSTGVGEYKTYVVKNSEADKQRINALATLLDKNGIQYEFAGGSTKGTIQGYNYFSGKDEVFTIDGSDLMVHSQQPKSAMVKVLFEPKSKLVDSNTYDITAWSLPYAYGLRTYGSKTKLQSAAGTKPPTVSNNVTDAYGYVIRWQGLQSVKALTNLFKEGVKVRFSEAPFEINGQQFNRGSLIIIKKGNEKFGSSLASIINQICNANNVKANVITTGFVDKGFDFGSSKIHFMKAPRVALLTGEGVGSNAAGEVWNFFEQAIDYPVTLVNANDFGRINWREFDVMIMPSGNYRFLTEKPSTDQLKDWISKGGRLVAFESAVAQLAKTDWAIKSKKADDSDKKDPYAALQVYEERERETLRSNIPGSIFKVQIDNTHPLAFGYPNFYYTLKQDDALYEFIKDGGWNVGVLKKDSQVSGFVGSSVKDKLNDALVFGVQDMGGGKIIYLADNLLFRNFWENGKLMFCNAVFLVGQ
ncbi:MAG TPA: M14 metallopeptidase family protein [Chitinophagaceae bacterium]|nr:M14 metallopeptidase family protein [Chitinophagaceae bacterium]